MIREKKHRLRAEAYVGPVIVSFVICTAGRHPFFNDPSLVRQCEAFLREAFDHARGHVGVFLFMPDHLHLIVSAKERETNLLDLVTRFKQRAAYHLRKAGLEFGWQKDFYDHVIRENEDYGAQVRYLLRNPVRKGLCEHWEQWPHKGVLGQTWEELAMAIATL